MTVKDQRELNGEFNEAEFCGFAKSYLLEAFPNPQRIGCPPDSDLQRMAEHPSEALDAIVSEHLTCCSPCFNRYMEILTRLKQHPKLEVRRRQTIYRVCGVEDFLRKSHDKASMSSAA